MRRDVLFLLLGMVLAGCLGCSQERLARDLLVRSTWQGKFSQQLAGSPESLKKSGTIDEYRRFPVADGSKIAVWVLKARAGGTGTSPPTAGFPRGTVVVLHGMGESKADYLKLGRGLAAKGFDVVLIDLRTHGNSTGNYVTYGYQERYDVKTVVDELIGEHIVSRRVYAFGISLGASTAIQYAAITPKCKGVIAVAPFQDAYSICREQLWYVKKDQFEQVLKKAGQMGKFIVEDASALQAAKVMDRKPIVIIHGKLDRQVPFSHGQAIFNAAENPKHIIPVRWGWHSLMTLGGTDGMIKQLEDLDTRARIFEKRYGTPSATTPKAPPLPPSTIKSPAAPKMPATRPARPAPATRPTFPPLPPAVREPLPPAKPAPVTRPAAPVIPPGLKLLPPKPEPGPATPTTPEPAVTVPLPPTTPKPPPPSTHIPIKPAAATMPAVPTAPKTPKAPTSRPSIKDLLLETIRPTTPKAPTSRPTIELLQPTTKPAATPYRPFRAP